MIQLLVGQPSRHVQILFSALCAAAVFLALPGLSDAKDAKSDARNQIRLLKAQISKASQEISTLDGRIFAGDLLIAANEVAIEEAKKKKDNDAAVLALQVTLAALKIKKNDLMKDKQDWEKSRRESQKLLAEWEAYLRKLGG